MADYQIIMIVLTVLGLLISMLGILMTIILKMIDKRR